MFVAIVRGILGFIAAVLVAGVVQVLFVAGADIFGGLDRLESLGLLALLAATQSAVFSAPFAVLAAVIAGWQSLRSLVFYISAGLVIALAGFFAQFASEAGPGTILNRYALAAYLTSGLAAGLTYWYVAVPKRRAITPNPQ